MTLGIRDNSLSLSPLATQAPTEPTGLPAPPPDGRFAGRLDAALATDGATNAAPPIQAQALAEALKLQMLHTTLALAGDQPAPSGSLPLERQSAAMRALLDSYRSNLPEEKSPSDVVAPSRAPTSASAPSADIPSTPLPEQSRWLESIISKASARYGVDGGLITAVIKTESNFNPKAVSPAGARGLMQLMPATARGLGVDDPFDPEQNVMAGTRFLRTLLDRYDGDLDSALAAYNWGPGNVDRSPERLPRETRNYLARVKQLYGSSSA